MVALVPPVPAPTTIQRGSGCGSSASWLNRLSAMLLLPRQSVARSAWVNWSMWWPPRWAAMASASAYTRAAGTSTHWPPWKVISCSLRAAVPCGTTAMKGRPSSLAKWASLMAVDPDDASTMGVPGPISPLHRP